MQEEEKRAFEALKEQIEGFRKELGKSANKSDFESLTSKIENLEKGIEKMSEKNVDKEILDINEKIQKFHDQIVRLREEQLELKEKGSAPEKREFVSKEEIKKFVEDTFDEFGEKTSTKARLTVKAPEDFGTASFVSGSQIDVFTGRAIDPTLYQRTRKRNLILDHMAISSIDVPVLYFMEKEEVGTGTAPDNGAGGADWIVSGAEKPKRSFRVKTGKVEAKKVAIFGTIDDKLLRDVPSFESWILEDFRDEMDEAYNDDLLNNGADADAPKGLKDDAILFEVTPSFDEKIPLAGYIDGVVAMAASMANNKEIPAKVFVSTDVFYAMHVEKTTDGKYQNNNLVYTNSVGQLFVAGVQVVEADSDDIPSTHALMVSANLGFKIRNYGGMVLERGLNGSDFRNDKTSFRGYREVLSYIPSHRLNSVMYDTWANVLTAITLPVTP